MILNISIDINDLDADGRFSRALQEEITAAVVNKIIKITEDSVVKKISETAADLAQAKTEQLIHSALERPITINKGWNESTEYDSVYDFIETELSSIYQNKLQKTGNCKKDPLLVQLEQHITKTATQNVERVEKYIKSEAEASALRAINESELMKTFGKALSLKRDNRGRETHEVKDRK